MRHKIIQLTFCVLLLFSRNLAHAQSAEVKVEVKKDAKAASEEKEATDIIRTATDLKSGNWQDVLTSFFHLSISDLTGDNKSLNFKSTLFGIKVKADSSLLLDKKYIKQQFARNFQFDFSLKLDSQYKFKGFQTGFTWALVNKRDSTVFKVANTAIDTFYMVGQQELQDAFMRFRQSLSDDSNHVKIANLALFKKIKILIDTALAQQGFYNTKSYPKEFQSFLTKAYEKNIIIANELFNGKLEELRRKPLLTLSVNSTFKNEQKAFKNGAIQFIYLQGIKLTHSTTELDLRAGATIGDTLVAAITKQRSMFKASAGINFSLFRESVQKSIFELKPYFEYQSVLSSLISNEKRDVFTANADIRIRIMENLWIPLIVKYDLNKKNFLGFLNVALNFNALKGK